MSTIVGYRDKLLQAAPVRNIAPDAGAFLLLTSDTPVFHVTVNSAGAPIAGSPAAINLTATLFGLPHLSGADIVWSITAGSATLTGSGATRQLAYANLATTSATVRATATYSGVSFYMELVLSKVTDGANGVPGSDGVIGKSARIAYTLIDGFSLNYNPLTATVDGDNRPVTGTWGETRVWKGSIDAAPAAGQAWFQSNGTYDATVGVNKTVWTTPYMSNLKVGNLEALTVNTGNLTFTGVCQSGNGRIVIDGPAGTLTLNGADGSGLTSVKTNTYDRYYQSGQIRISIGAKP